MKVAECAGIAKEAPIEEAKTQDDETPKVQTDLNKCWNCNKKVGVVKVPCRCGFVYCAKHRHAEAHQCDFDYLAMQQAKIIKENPVIQAMKMDKI